MKRSLTLPVHYDHGYDAPLYQASPYLAAGLIAQWAHSDKLSLGVHLHDALQIGGEVKESPCYDGFRRRFHCGTGLPWSDAAPHLRDKHVSPSIRMTLDWRF